MRNAVLKAAFLVGHGRQKTWVGLIGLAVAVTIFEALAAFAIFALLSFVTGAASAIEVPVLGRADRLLDGHDDRTVLLVFAGITAGIFLIRGALYLGLTYAQNRAAQNAGARLASRLFGGYLRMPYAFHLRRNSAELVRNLHGSTYEFVSAILVPGISIVSESLLLVAVLMVLLSQAPVATAFTVLTIGPAVLLLLRGVQPRMSALGQDNQEQNKFNILLQQQSFQGVKDIKILGKERFFEEAFERSRFRVARSYYLRSALSEVPRVAIETTLILFVLGFLGVVAVREGSVESALATLGLFGYAVLRMLPSLSRILAHLNNLRFGGAALDLLYEDLQMVEEILSRPSASSAPGITLIEELRLDGVSFRYEGSDAWAVRNVDLVVRPGDSIGLVGHSGGGKSTLIDLILGLLPPSSGRVLADGRDIQTDVHSWHQNLSVVFQHVYLMDDTIRQNVALGVEEGEIDDDSVRRALRIAQLERFVESLPDGWDTPVGEAGVRLSGGQRQRIAIARAVYRDAKLLILDEGTAALDDATESDFVTALESVREHLTLVMVAHRTSTLRICDRILLVEDGRVTSLGDYSDFLSRDLHPGPGASR